jgi:glycosyltransferase involved in cell wall biosynthesis
MVCSSSPSRVCALLQCTNLGGMEQSAYFVMENAAANWRVATPRVFGEGKARVFAVDPGARETFYRGKFGLLSQFEFVENCRERAEGCSHTWITGTDVACLRAAKQLRLPTLLGHHYHHFDGALNVARWKLFYELLVKGRAEVTYPTDFTRNEGIRISPWLQRCSHVVRYHFPLYVVSRQDRDEAKQRLGFESDAFVVGNAGWLIERKRWDVFLETAFRVAAKSPHARFVICGGGPLEEPLRRQAANLGLSDLVSFTGWCDDLADYYKAFDVLLFNSDFDALGRTPGEAMGYGAVPVASVSYGGLAELVEHERNGFLISNHDADLLAGYIMQLAESPSLREDFSAAGKQMLEQRYSAEAATGFYRNWFGC